MEVFAYSKGIRVSTRKIRLVAQAIRNLPVEKALEYLSVMDKRGAYSLTKTLNSAVANARNNAKLDVKDLIIKTLQVDESPALKRFHASTRGRVHPYKRRGTHIRIVLSDNKPETINSKTETNNKIQKNQSKKGGLEIAEGETKGRLQSQSPTK